MVAPAFVLSVLLTPLLVMWLGVAGFLHLALYAVANLAASFRTAAASQWSYLPVLPLVFATVHLSWGSGFWAGLLYWPVYRAVRGERPPESMR